MTIHPAHSSACTDCGTAVDLHDGQERCPACFDKYLFDIDVDFLDSYRKFGARSRLIVAETCLRGLVTESPEHRKILAMSIFEQYVGAMNDLAGLFTAFRNRNQAPILKSFLEFRLDAATTPAFFDAVQSASDVDLLGGLNLPLPGEAALLCEHLDEDDAYQVAIALYHLVQDLRTVTSQGDLAAMALSQYAGQMGGAIIANDASWLNGAGKGLKPDQVAMLVLDSRRRSVFVHGLSAEEGSMAQVVNAIDTATRASSNLIFAYLQTNNL